METAHHVIITSRDHFCDRCLGEARCQPNYAPHQLILIEVEFPKRNSNSRIGGIRFVLQTEIGHMRRNQSLVRRISNLEEWTGRRSWR
jgi:hypothetical protein